jgi:hypothetical protein
MKETLIKIYFYLNNGVGILNNFRNLFLGVFALYFTLKLTSPVLLVVMFIVAIPILVVCGYYNVHHIARLSEQLSVKFGTFYGIKQFELTEEQVKLLKEIKKLLSKKK